VSASSLYLRRDSHPEVVRRPTAADRPAFKSVRWQGHHEGDVHENVLSNVMKGAQLLNIAGIAASSTVNGVRIFR
jgi:hypothetical protein